MKADIGRAEGSPVKRRFWVREHNDEPLIPIRPKGVPITPRDDDGERIVGGSDASPGEFPFIVSFQELTRTWRRAFCGGTIYDESTVITAAHCINQNDLGKLYVVGGEHSLESTSGTEQKLKVKKMITHYGYNSRTLNNDIAILQLDGKFDFSGKYVKSIPTCKGDYSGDVTVCGWGTTSEGGNQPDILKKTTIPTVSYEKCNRVYGNINSNMICAGLEKGETDSCQGDSGGPLVRGTGQESYSCLVGVVSFGSGCARPGTPGVYANVSRYIGWIENHACGSGGHTIAVGSSGSDADSSDSASNDDDNNNNENNNNNNDNDSSSGQQPSNDNWSDISGWWDSDDTGNTDDDSWSTWSWSSSWNNNDGWTNWSSWGHDDDDNDDDEFWGSSSGGDGWLSWF